jgi:hypothetical protein
MQRRNAERRGIEFCLSFEWWCEIWRRHFSKRGRNRGQYVMARRGDRGPYRLGNVKIITIEENSREQHENMSPEARDLLRRRSSECNVGPRAAKRRWRLHSERMRGNMFAAGKPKSAEHRRKIREGVLRSIALRRATGVSA